VIVPLVASTPSSQERVYVDVPMIVPFFHRGAPAPGDSGVAPDSGRAARELTDALGVGARVLQAYGVRFILVDADTVVFTWRNGTRRQFALPAGERAAYVFAGPPETFAVEHGVMTDVAVVCAAKRHFDLRGSIRIHDVEC
jgi:hypothetical protein